MSFTLLTDRGSGFSEGSVVDVYWDDAAEDFTVYLDEVLVTSGPGLGEWEVDYTNLLTMYQFCEGTTLNNFYIVDKFNPYFPYAKRMQVENHFSCVAVACDLAFQGTPTVTPASNPIAADGEITIQATSSYTVEYSLSPFEYGEGQASGTFSGLTTGVYTVYAKDEYGCSSQIQVTVPVTVDEYGVKHRIQYYDRDGNTTRDELLERGYIDAVDSIKADSIPSIISLDPSPSDNKYIPIRGRRMVLNAVTPRLEQFKYLSVFTQDDRKYKLRRQKDTGSGYETVWEGYVLPSLYSEPYVSPPYVSQIEAIDGLEILDKSLFIDSDGNMLYGEMKLIKIVAFILNKLDLNLSIRVAANIYEENHNSADTDDPFDQTYLDLENFIDDGEVLDCQEVLSRILEPFGAFIVQEKGYWWIVRYEELTDSFDYREFDAAGDYVSNGSYDPVKDIKGGTFENRLAMMNQDQNLDIVPAYGNFIIDAILNEKGSTIDGTFEKRKLKNQEDDTLGFHNWSLILNGTTDSFNRYQIGEDSVGGFNIGSITGRTPDTVPFIRSKSYDFEYGSNDKIRLSIDAAVAEISSLFPFLIIQTRVKLGDKYLSLQARGSRFSTTETGGWVEDEHFLRYYPSVSDGFAKSEILVNCPPTSGRITETLIIDVYAMYPAWAEFGVFNQDVTLIQDGLTDFKAFPTDDLTEWKTVVLRFDEVSGVPEDEYYLYYDFYELVRADVSPEEVDPDYILPDDYDQSTNNKAWKLIKRVTGARTTSAQPMFIGHGRGTILPFYNTFYIRSIDLDILPGGQDPKQIVEIKFPNQPKLIKEVFEKELNIVDLPTGAAYINNSKNIYNNYLRLSDGTPTGRWTRDGLAEANTIQQIYSKMVVAQYREPSQRITGSYISDVHISPIDCLRISKAAESLSLENEEFTTDLDGWLDSDTVWSWNDDLGTGTAKTISLTGTASSSVLYQLKDITAGTMINIAYSIHEGAATSRRVSLDLLLADDPASPYDRISLVEFQTGTRTGSKNILVPLNIGAIGFQVRYLDNEGTIGGIYRLEYLRLTGVTQEKKFLIAGLSDIDPRQRMYSIDMIELKPVISAGAAVVRAHSSAHSSAHS